LNGGSGKYNASTSFKVSVAKKQKQDATRKNKLPSDDVKKQGELNLRQRVNSFSAPDILQAVSFVTNNQI
jgi:hypothetical protein